MSDQRSIFDVHGPVQRHDTKDGSTTLFSENFQQYYHNPNGALSESELVFFSSNGLNQRIQASNGPIHIFEMGFGTGLNFLLAAHKMIEADNSHALHFYSVEAYPITSELANGFTYPITWAKPELNTWLPEVFSGLNQRWNTFQPDPSWPIYLHLYVGYLKEIQTQMKLNHPIDYYFHDAFSVEQNPECWTDDVFMSYQNWGHAESILSTYAAASRIRAAMAAADWKVFKAPGALGKREMTLACHPNSKAQPVNLTPCPNERLKNRWFGGEWN